MHCCNVDIVMPCPSLERMPYYPCVYVIVCENSLSVVCIESTPVWKTPETSVFQGILEVYIAAMCFLHLVDMSHILGKCVLECMVSKGSDRSAHTTLYIRAYIV